MMTISIVLSGGGGRSCCWDQVDDEQSVAMGNNTDMGGGEGGREKREGVRRKEWLMVMKLCVRWENSFVFSLDRSTMFRLSFIIIVNTTLVVRLVVEFVLSHHHCQYLDDNKTIIEITI